MTTIIQHLFNALTIASIYLLVALGITLLFGLLRLVNFTQGLLAGLGAFVCLEFTQIGLPLAVALALSALTIGVGSLALLGLFQRTLTTPFTGFVITLGLIMALPPAYALIWPGDTYSIPTSLTGVWELHGVFVDQRKVVLISVTLVLTAALVLSLNRTQFGRGVRAVAQNLTAARVLGVPVFALTAVTFVVGSGLAALAGGLLGMTFSFNAYTGNNYLLDAFAVAVIGGLGSIGGSVVAALILAVSETFGGAYISQEWAPAFSLTAIVLVVLVRPHGLFGTTEAGESLGTAEAALAISEDPRRAVRVHARGAWGGLRTRAVSEVGIQRAAALAGAGVLVAAPWILPTQRLLTTAVYAMVLVVATYGVWYLFRFGGVMSIAQAAFMGIGAYATGLSISHWELNFWLQIPLAMAAASTVAVVMGAVALRTRGSYFLIVIFAMVELVVVVLANWRSLTGGYLGLVNVVPAEPFGGVGNFRELDQQYWLALGFVGTTIIMVYLLMRSSFTRRLTAVRDNELLAQSLGLNTFWHQLVAWVIAGALGGLAGVMLLYQQLAVEPDMFGLWPGAVFLLTLLLGGSGSLAGPIIGSVLFAFLPEVLSLGPNTTQVFQGMLLVVLIIFWPRGVSGALQVFSRRLARSLPESAEPEPAYLKREF